MSIKHEFIADYKLVPMGEITEEAKAIAVLWVENYEPMGFDLPGKHKLASDIMNYARHYHENRKEKLLAAYREMRKALESAKAGFDVSNQMYSEWIPTKELNDSIDIVIKTLEKYPEL